jgi:hypothetical protein
MRCTIAARRSCSIVDWIVARVDRRASHLLHAAA